MSSITTRLFSLFLLVLTATPILFLHADHYTFTIPPFSGNGSCSPTAVDALSYTVVTSPTPITAVFACNKPSFDALINANLSDPQTATLPPPLVELSCVNSNSTTCEKSFPSNRKLKPQIMCVLLKNWGRMPLNATMEVSWRSTAGSTNATGTATTNTSAGATPPKNAAAGVGRGGVVNAVAWGAFIAVVTTTVGWTM